ncbi:MAG: tRNA (N6-isopentenyl adenosine(37)-C2)-methylthiotransferase MiaB [Spirochaetota bacterium]
MHKSINKYYIETYGCEMNKSDSIDIALSFENMGYEKASTEEEASVIVLNTCSVRPHAEQRIMGRLGYYRSLKKKYPDKIIVLAGCLAQQKSAGILGDFPEINVVAGTYRYTDIPVFVNQSICSGSPVVAANMEDFSFSPFKEQRAEGHRAWVNIINGCSNFCAYCIVPFLRGPEKSKPSGEVIEEISRLASRGVKEVTLLGQNVNAYGSDSGDLSFIELLERINQITGISWIRFLTSHPKDFDRETVKRIASLEKVCRQFHLPVQSGSDRMLSGMNRRYSTAHYLGIVDAIREYMPEASITTDIMVGFPGEALNDFEQTMNLVRRVRFDDAFTYRYYDRPFTRSSRMEHKPDPSEARQRLDRLVKVQRNISVQKNKELIGSRRWVLVERKSKKSSLEYLCKTEQGKMVVVETRAPIGSFIQAYINGISGNTLKGKQIAPSEREYFRKQAI